MTQKKEAQTHNAEPTSPLADAEQRKQLTARCKEECLNRLKVKNTQSTSFPLAISW